MPTRLPPDLESAKNAVGPKLNSLLGRRASAIEGYSCSPTNKSSGILWGEPRFRAYIKAPRAKISSPKMVFPGFKSEQEVDAILAFLKQFAADGKKNWLARP